MTRVQPDFKHCAPFTTTPNEQKQTSGRNDVINGTDAVNDVTSDVTTITNGDKPTRVVNGNMSSSGARATTNKPDGSRFVPSFTKSTLQGKKSQPTKNPSQISSITNTNLGPGTPMRPVFESKVIPKVHSNDRASSTKLHVHTQKTSSLPSKQPRKLPPGAQSGSFLPNVQTNQDAPCAKKLPEVRPGLVLMRGDQTRSAANSPYAGLIGYSTSDEVNFGHESANIIDNTNNVPRTQSVSSNNCEHKVAVASQGPIIKNFASKENVLGLPAKRQVSDRRRCIHLFNIP